MSAGRTFIFEDVKEKVEELSELLEIELHGNPVAYKNDEQIHKVEQLYKNAILQFKKQSAYLKSEQKVENLYAKILRATEVAAHEIVGEKEEDEHKEHQEEHKKKKKMGNVPTQEERAKIQGSLKTQTQDNTKVAEPKSTIQRGGFGKTGAAVAQGEAAQKAKAAEDLAIRQDRMRTKGRVISRGGNADRAHESKPMRRISAGGRSGPTRSTGPNRKGTPTRPPTKSPTKSPSTIPPRPKQPLPYSQSGIPTPTKKPIVDQSTKIVIPPPTVGPVPTKNFQIIPDEYEPEFVPEYPEYGAGTEDRRARPGPPDVAPVVPLTPTSAPAAPSQQPQDNGDDGGGGGHHRLPRRPGRKNPLGSKAAKGMGRSLGRLGAQIGKQAVLAVARSPVGLIVIGVIIAILIIAAIIMAILGGGEEQNNQNNAQETLVISKTGPAAGKVGDILTYTITISDTQPALDVTIIDHIPDGVSLNQADITSSWTKFKFDPITKTITWTATENMPLGATFVGSTTFTVSYKVIQESVKLITWAEATARREGGSAGYTAPGIDACNGKYRLTNPIQKNFGDPTCKFDKDQLHTMLQQQDPQNAEVWFNKIVPCESGYNPNAYAGPQTGTPDAAGAWGLYQMGSSTPPGSPPPAEGKNGPNDRGDVNWEAQTSNAVAYGKKIGSLGKYWACAR